MTVNFSSLTLLFHLPKLFGSECQLSAPQIKGYGLLASEKINEEGKKKKVHNLILLRNIFKPLLEMKLDFILFFI